MIYGVYTEELIEKYYNLMAEESKNGYKYNNSLRKETEGFSREEYQSFTMEFSSRYPDVGSSFPTKDKLIADLVIAEEPEAEAEAKAKAKAKANKKCCMIL